MDKNFKGMCEKCRKRKSCKIPCAPVENLLQFDNRGASERLNRNENTITLFPVNRREMRETELLGLAETGGKDQDAVDFIFSTDNDKAFTIPNPQKDKTAVFVYKFFKGFSYEDIAVMMDKPVNNVRQLYRQAKARMLKALKALDTRDGIIHKAENILKVSEEATGKLPNYQKWFIMNKCLGLSPGEIARIEGRSQSCISTMLRYCADKLMAGELTLLDPTPEQAQEAKARLDRDRARVKNRREAANKKQSKAA